MRAGRLRGPAAAGTGGGGVRLGPDRNPRARAAVFGVDRYDGGEVRVAGRRLPLGRPAAAMAAGMALVPEDRRQQGLVMELSVERNTTLTRRWSLARFGLLGSAPCATRCSLPTCPPTRSTSSPAAC